MVGDHAGYQKFQQNLLELEKRADAPSAAEILAVAGAMGAALEAYNQRTTQYIQAQTQDVMDATLARLERTV